MKKHEKENINSKFNHVTEEDLSSETEENEDNFIFKMEDVDIPRKARKPISSEAVQVATLSDQQDRSVPSKTIYESLNEPEASLHTSGNPQTFFASNTRTLEPIVTKGIFARLLDQLWSGLSTSYSP